MRGLSREYVLRRLVMFFLTIWLASTLIFIIPRLMPGDPVSAMVSRISAQAGSVENSEALIASWRKRFGLDEPVLVQYGRYLRNSITLDLGYSLAYFPGRVEQMVAQALPWTVGLLVLATVISFVAGNTIGAVLAWHRTPKLLRALLPLTLTFTAIPFFMLGILLIYVFGFWLGWAPITGAFESGVVPGLNL
ncbi:MAG: ABC transporter permease, partial [Actinobacteria bacterium]|nr:ABC transporter permease [Actinomycetota bacterium]